MASLSVNKRKSEPGKSLDYQNIFYLIALNRFTLNSTSKIQQSNINSSQSNPIMYLIR